LGLTSLNYATFWKNKLKSNTKNSYERVDKQNYKRKYLLRKIEDKEADERIKRAKAHNKLDTMEVSEMQQLDPPGVS
jgi:hypothetical protein